MISLLAIITLFYDRINEDCLSELSIGVMIGVFAVDMYILYFIDKVFF